MSSIAKSDNLSPSHPPAAGRREWIGLAVLVLACVVYAMDLTVLHLAVPSISVDLQPSGTQLLWIIDIYGFMVAGFLITMGTLGDRIGRRRLLMIGAAGFSLTSLLAAFAQTPDMLIMARALMGISGAMLAPSTLSLIFSMFLVPRQRSIAVGIWISGFSAGSAIGPMLGGLLLQNYWWGSVFLLALPVMILLLILGPRLLPEYRNPQAGRLDLTSAFMSLAVILAVIFGLKEIAQDGLSAAPLAFLAAGLALGLAFVRRQQQLEDPLIDPQLFRIPTFNVALAVNLIAVFVAFGYFLFVAQYLQLVLGLTPLQAGLASLPSAVGFIVGSNVAPRFVHRVRPALVLAVGLGTAAASLLAMTRTSTESGLAILIVSSVLNSLAMAPVITLTTELIVGSAPPERAGVASGISETAAELGGALGIAVLGSLGMAVYRSQLARNLPANLPGEALAAAQDTLGAAIEFAGQLPAGLGAQLSQVSQQAFVRGLHVVALTSAVIALFAVGLVVFALRSPTVAASEWAAQPEAEREQRAAGIGALPGD